MRIEVAKLLAKQLLRELPAALDHFVQREPLGLERLADVGERLAGGILIRPD
jgi:hypothetical protein